MSDLFTKAANIKTSTKLWVIGIALLIMVNLSGSENPSPSAPVSAPSAHSTSDLSRSKRYYADDV
jgi:hypothetical protein